MTDTLVAAQWVQDLMVRECCLLVGGKPCLIPRRTATLDAPSSPNLLTRLEFDLQSIEQVRSELKFRGAQGMQVVILLFTTGLAALWVQRAWAGLESPVFVLQR